MSSVTCRLENVERDLATVRKEERRCGCTWYSRLALSKDIALLDDKISSTLADTIAKAKVALKSSLLDIPEDPSVQMVAENWVFHSRLSLQLPLLESRNNRLGVLTSSDTLKRALTHYKQVTAACQMSPHPEQFVEEAHAAMLPFYKELEECPLVCFQELRILHDDMLSFFEHSLKANEEIKRAAQIARFTILIGELEFCKKRAVAQRAPLSKELVFSLRALEKEAAFHQQHARFRLAFAEIKPFLPPVDAVDKSLELDSLLYEPSFPAVKLQKARKFRFIDYQATRDWYYYPDVFEEKKALEALAYSIQKVEVDLEQTLAELAKLSLPDDVEKKGKIYRLCLDRLEAKLIAKRQEIYNKEKLTYQERDLLDYLRSQFRAISELRLQIDYVLDAKIGAKQCRRECAPLMHFGNLLLSIRSTSSIFNLAHRRF